MIKALGSCLYTLGFSVFWVLRDSGTQEMFWISPLITLRSPPTFLLGSSFSAPVHRLSLRRVLPHFLRALCLKTLQLPGHGFSFKVGLDVQL